MSKKELELLSRSGGVAANFDFIIIGYDLNYGSFS